MAQMPHRLTWRDREKFTNSRIQHPYLVHLSRMPSGYQEETEVIIAGIEAPTQIAYVHHDLEQRKSTRCR
jgi:hypothetical protein